MLHIKLKPDDVLLVRSIYGTRELSTCIVIKTTRKTVVTKTHPLSSMIDRHGNNFGYPLFVYDEEKYNRVKELQSGVAKLQREIREIMLSLEQVTILDV